MTAAALDRPAERAANPARTIPPGARGEAFEALTGSGLVLALLMVAGLLGFIAVTGLRTFWPNPVVELKLDDGTVLLGEPWRSETSTGDNPVRRRLLRTANFDLTGEDFRWVDEPRIASEAAPADAFVVERSEWGRAIGRLEAVVVDGKETAAGPAAAALLPRLRSDAEKRLAEIRRIEREELGALAAEAEEARLEIRRAALRSGEESPAHRKAAADAASLEERLAPRRTRLEQRLVELRDEDARTRLRIRTADSRFVPERQGSEDFLLASQVVRAYPANSLSLAGRFGVYLDRWKEFLTAEPREANTEGGILPALFGTFLMTVLMALAVAPVGVVAALYLREYARQGAAVAAVRIAVNNLAGVPSIVFGVFGLGFFCYGVGGTIDRVFFPERLPNPTWGTGGILWASLTLALMTIPVVVVATEEALASVPRGLREASYGCGASRWQTVRRVVLPHATPGILTGLVLAMARGAGEVAPLMLTGVVKLAPELPFDGTFPFFHPNRSFMHLGFHIFDVGFQSRDAEAGKPMVFTTTLLLVALIAAMNLGALLLRARLRKRFRSAQF